MVVLYFIGFVMNGIVLRARYLPILAILTLLLWRVSPVWTVVIGIFLLFCSTISSIQLKRIKAEEKELAQQEKASHV